MCVGDNPQCSRRAARGSCFSPTLWIKVTEFSNSGLEAGALTCWAISPALKVHLYEVYDTELLRREKMMLTVQGMACLNAMEKDNQDGDNGCITRSGQGSLCLLHFTAFYHRKDRFCRGPQSQSPWQSSLWILSNPNEESTKSLCQELLVEHGNNEKPVLCWSEF